MKLKTLDFKKPSLLLALFLCLFVNGGCYAEFSYGSDRSQSYEYSSSGHEKDLDLILESRPYLTDSQGGKSREFSRQQLIEQILPFRPLVLLDAWNLKKLKKYVGYLAPRGSNTYIIIDNQNWSLMPKEVQEAAIDSLQYELYGSIAYRPLFNSSQNDSNILPKRFQDREGLPVEWLMNSFVKRWAQRFSETIGPNCFHSALAATAFPNLEPKQIDEDRFMRILQENFVRVNSQEPKFQDIVVFYDNRNYPLHAAVVVGRDAKRPETIIVFTKNGMQKGAYLFSDLNTLKYKVFTNTDHIEIWRMDSSRQY